MKVRIQNETKYCAGHLPTCGAVVSDTGYGIDLLYKQDKFGCSLITAVRFQEQIDNSEEKKRVRPESKLKTDKTQSFQTKPDEAGTALSIYKLNIATYKSKAETEKTTELVEQMDFDHLDKARNQQIIVQNRTCDQINQKFQPCHESKKIWGGASYVVSGMCCCLRDSES